MIWSNHSPSECVTLSWCWHFSSPPPTSLCTTALVVAWRRRCHRYSIVGIKVGKLRLPLSQGRDCEPQLSRETKTKPFIHLSVVFFAESHCQLRIWLNDEKKKNKRKKIHRLVSFQAIDIGLVLDTSKPPHNETKSSYSFFSRASQDYQPSSTASVPLFSLYNHMVIYFFLPIARKSVALVFGLATSCVCLSLYISIEVSAWSQVRYTYFKTKP